MSMHEDDKQNRGAEWIGIGLTFGTGIGIVVGTILDSVALGLSMGAGLGIVFGALVMSIVQEKHKSD